MCQGALIVFLYMSLSHPKVDIFQPITAPSLGIHYGVPATWQILNIHTAMVSQIWATCFSETSLEIGGNTFWTQNETLCHDTSNFVLTITYRLASLTTHKCALSEFAKFPIKDRQRDLFWVMLFEFHHFQFGKDVFRFLFSNHQLPFQFGVSPSCLFPWLKVPLRRFSSAQIAWVPSWGNLTAARFVESIIQPISALTQPMNRCRPERTVAFPTYLGGCSSLGGYRTDRLLNFPLYCPTLISGLVVVILVCLKFCDSTDCLQFCSTYHTRWTNKQTNKQPTNQPNKQTNKHASKQASKQTNKQRNKQTRQMPTHWEFFPLTIATDLL